MAKLYEYIFGIFDPPVDTKGIDYVLASEKRDGCARKVYRRSHCVKRNTRLPLASTANDLASVLNILFAECRYSCMGHNDGRSRTRDVNRCYVVHRARIYIRVTMKQVGHLRQTVQPARESETELALLKNASWRTRARKKKRERERRTEEEQEAGVFRDVACAVYANWARVNARDAQDGI